MKLSVFGKITAWSLKNARAVYFLIVAIIFLGALTYNNMTKSIFPTVKFPYVSVYTTMIGASAEDIEKMVTKPIEDAIRDESDLLELRSTSSGGSSLVVLKFREGIDQNQKVQSIQSKVTNVINQLPNQADKPIVEAYDVTKFPIILIDLPADKPYAQQMDIIDELKQEIGKVDGVTKIVVTGLNKPRVNILPDMKKMEHFGITYAQIISIVKNSGLNIPLGDTDINGMNYSIQTDNQIQSLSTLESLILNHSNAQVLKLEDIASVEYVDEVSKTKTYSIKSGERSSMINLQIFKDKEADTIAINNQVKSIVENYNNKYPYNGVDYSMDLSVYISKSITDVANNALSGLLSVIVVLFLFIHLREAIIASMVIPLTLVGSIILFEPFGLTVNIFTIMGLIIALGMLVDNAIVVIEMIDEAKKKKSDLSFREIVTGGANQVGAAIFSSTVTTICAFIPLAFLTGEDGAIIRVIPIAMAIAMSISFIVSVTVTPVLAYSFLKNDRKDGHIIVRLMYIVIVVVCAAYAFSNNWQLTTLSYIAAVVIAICSFIKVFKPFKNKIKGEEGERGFIQIIRSVMNSKVIQTIIVLLTITLFVYSLNLLTGGKIPNESMPQADSQSLSGKISLIKGSTREDSMEIFEQVEAFLATKPYIKQYSVTVGKDTQNYYIELKHKSERDLHSKYIIDELTSFTNKIPDIKGVFNVEGEESGALPIAIRLYGKDQKILIKESERVQSILSMINGTLSPQADYAYGSPTIKIAMDKEQAAKMNVDVSDILMQLRYLVAGEKITTIKVDEANVSVYLRTDNPIKSTSQIKQIKVANSKGLMIPLDTMVKVEESRSVSEIYHFNSKKMITVSAGYEKTTSVEQIINNFEETLKNEGGLSEGVTYEIAGDYATMNASYSDMGKKLIMALVLVYLVLLLQFNSYLQPFAIILCVPFSVIGVALGYYFTGLTFSTLTFLGIVSLVGIAINDAIVLIDYINTLRKNGVERLEAIIQGCNSRFKPIIATSLTTIAGVLPLALYSEDYSQMAYALIFGLCSSTLLTLFVVPSILNGIEGVTGIITKWRQNNVKTIEESI